MLLNSSLNVSRQQIQRLAKCSPSNSLNTLQRTFVDTEKYSRNTTTGERVIINISGEKYETYAVTLNRYPETLLGTREKRNAFIDEITNELYINRSRIAFGAILFFYQSNGILNRPSEIAMTDFENECEYYGIPESAMKIMKEKEAYLYYKKRKITKYYADYRKKMLQFFDLPLAFHNRFALVYFIISYTLTIISVLIYCAETEYKTFVKDKSVLQSIIDVGFQVELYLHIYFAIEFFLRLHSYPYLQVFFEGTVNLMEIFLIFIYFPIYLIPYNPVLKMTLMNAVRLLRPVRLTRISRVSKPIKIALSVFQKSYHDVMAVVFCILIITILSGSAMYFIEYREPGTQFTSIPNSMWWAIQSTICLGYGDMVPQTAMGKACGCPVIFFGVTTVTILILSLGGRFFETYSKEIYDESWLPDNLK